MVKTFALILIDGYRGFFAALLGLLPVLACAARLFRILDRRPNDNVAAVRSRHRAADQNHFLRFAHLHDLQILHRHALVTHMTGHAHVFPNPAGSGTIADGAVAPMRLRTVRRALAGEVVLLHHALEAFALRSADHIDEIAGLKLRDAQIDLAFRRIRFEAKFPHKFLRLGLRPS